MRTAPGLGPGSLLWAVAGDPRGLIPGTAAGIMQLMLPGLGAGVTDHSNFFDDPYDRIFRSIPYIWGSDLRRRRRQADDGAGTIRDFHTDIKGTDHHGHRYHALDPDVFWWAHATFTWEFFRARELYFPGPAAAARAGAALRRDRHLVPALRRQRPAGAADLDDFRARFDEICRDELELTPAVAWVLDPDDEPGAAPNRPRLPGPARRSSSGLAPSSGPRCSGCSSTAACPTSCAAGSTSPGRTATASRSPPCARRCGGSGPAIRRGFLADAFPEGTPHLDPKDPTRVVVAGPSRAQRQARDDERTRRLTGAPSGRPDPRVQPGSAAS